MMDNHATEKTRCGAVGILRQFVLGIMLCLLSWPSMKAAASTSTTTAAAPAVPSLTANAGTDKFLIGGQTAVLGGSPTASGGTSPYTYSWSPTTGLSNPTTSNPTVSSNTTRNYIVTVTDSFGNTAKDTVRVRVNAVLKAFAGLDKSITAGQTIQIGNNPAATGGYSPYTYSWSPTTNLSNPAAARPNANPATTTTYILTVTDIYSNVAKDTMTVLVNSQLTANAGADQAVCSGDSVILGGSPSANAGTSPYTYSWSPSTGLSNASASNPKAAPTTTTAYILQVTDASAASVKDTVVITVRDKPTASAGADKFVLANQPVVIGGSPTASGGTGPYTYSWSPTAGLNSATIANPTATVTSTRTYFLTVIDANGCSNKDTVKVNSRVALVANAGLDKNILPGGSVVIGTTTAATGGYPGYTYSWSPSTGLNNSTLKMPTATPAATTSYVLTATDTKGFTDTDTMTVFVGSIATANAGADKSICLGGSTTIGGSPTAQTGSAPFTYSWTPTTGLNDPTAANPTAAPTTTTTYVVHLTDSGSNTDTDTVVVTVNPNPIANAGTDKAICVGQTTAIGGSPTASSGTPGYTYSWTPSTGLDNPASANPNASPAATTSYVVLVSDAKGCSDTDTITVTVHPAPVAHAGNDVEACVGAGVSIGGSPAATGGTAPFTYAWAPTTGLNDATAANPIATPSATTSYVLTVTDQHGCTDTDTVLVTLNPKPTADAGVDKQFCVGDSASLGGAPSASGGTAPYSYSWSPATGLNDATSANPTASPSATTSYILTVTDAKNCVAMDTVLVTVSSGLAANAGVDKAISVGGSTTIGGSPAATGGIAPYTYSWSPLDSLDDATVANPTANPTTSTTYILTVTDAVGCTDIDTMQVLVSLLPIAHAGPDTAICAGSSVVIGGSPTASAGTSPYTYSWSPSTGLSNATIANPSAAPTSTTTYIVTVTDANTNSDTDTMTVVVNPVPVANAGSDANIILGNSANLGGSPSASSGTSPYTYAWSPATGLNDATVANPVATPADTTIYVLTITDSKGCSDTDTVIVYVNSANLPPSAIASANPTSGGVPLLVQFTGSASTDVDGTIVSYAWDFGDGNSSTQADPQYTYNALGNPIARLIVTDNGGAKDTAFVNISVIDCIALPAAAAYGKITGGDQTHVNDMTYCFPGTIGSKQLHYEIHDVDFNDEVAVRLNGKLLFYAPVTANNAWSAALNVFIPDSCILDSSNNVLVFDNTYNPPNTNIWGVRNVSLQVPPANQTPHAVASVTPVIGPLPLNAQFTGSGSFDIDGTIASYAWSFGDGNTSTSANPSHTYTGLGTFTAQLIVTDNGGLKDTTTVTVDAVTCITLPDANAYGKITGGDQTHVDKVTYCFPAMSGSPTLAYQVYDIDSNTEGDVYLNNVKIIDLAITGDLLWSSTRNFVLPDSLVYDGATNVLVFDNAKNPPSANEWGVRQVSVTGVVTNVAPTAVASANPTSGLAPLNVQFTGSSSTDSDGSIAAYAWTFGDGGSSTLADPQHVYNTPANYSARLIVTDNLGAKDTAFVNVQVNANQPPLAVASADVDSGAAPLAVNFTGSTSSDPDGSIASYLWNFGDGGTANTANAAHTYNVAGNYIASLIVTDNGGLKDTATVNITAQAPSGLPTIRVNAGGSLFTTTGGKVFSADQKYTVGGWGFVDSGFVRIETLAISGTPDPDLYRVQRERTQLDYKFDIPNGSYDVILHFAEIKDNVALNRVMDVSLEGTLVLDDFDLYVQAPGKGVALQRRFNSVNVADGQLHLLLVKSLSTYKRPCAIAAIEIGPAGVLPKAQQEEAPAVTFEVPSNYALEQNYPNPFNPSTNITFHLPEPGEVKLIVYNANGQFVRKVVDRYLDAGRHTVRFNASKLPSGTYFYELQANNFHARRKMILTR